jgi:hypothetical protein
MENRETVEEMLKRARDADQRAMRSFMGKVYLVFGGSFSKLMNFY